MSQQEPRIIIRTPDQRLRVFVSSTLQELADERAAARDAILQLRLAPVLFELGARPHPPRDLYRAYLDQSHIFIGIYWQKYGWVAPGETISGLEDEYQLSGDKPKLIYIKSPAPDREPRLKDLLERIKSAASYKYFTTASELRELIENDLMLLLTERFETSTDRLRPMGTVTFLFTDIEGSTDLVQQYPEAWPMLLARHQALLHQAMEAHHGVVFQISGDSFQVAFHTVLDALNAALDAQRWLYQEAWTPAPIKVRMGINTGVAMAGNNADGSGGYTGYSTLARAQRVMSAAHGGQVLLSNASAEQARGELPQGVTLRDMGEHRLKGWVQPEHLWQIVAPDLVVEFPPLPSLSTIPNNLPVSLTSFIGREREIGEIKGLLNETHLVTLTGPGGTGKTRLSLQVAADVLEQFTDGVWLVEFAPLADPSLVPQTVATALGVREQPGRPVLAQLTDYLRPKKLLLVLDNCEHLIVACAHLADALLHTCPNLRLISTSREAIGIAGETSYPVPPLQTPGLRDHITFSDLTQYESVRLFVERAQTVQPRFALSDANAEAVAQICRRLDGIPLAIELAAARIKLFTPEQIAERLDDRFRLLTGGSRTAVPRQQTLHALIEWSYDLLSPAECALLRRLSVFAGGWAFDAAEFVCTQVHALEHETSSAAEESSTPDVLDALTQLVNKSLVVVDEQGDETRYRFLETIRQFAHDKLLESGEAERICVRHLDYYLALARRGEPQLHGAEQVEWFDRLDVEEDNFRAALDWALKNGQIEKALELAGALWWFWYIRDHFGEARERMSAALARSAASDPDEARLKVLNGLGFILYAASNMPEARAVLEEAVSLSQKLGSRRGLAESLQFLGAVEFVEASKSTPGHFENVRNIMEQSLAHWQALGDKTGISWELNLLASVAQAEGDLTQSRALWEESVALRRVVGDRLLLAYSLRRLAEIALQQGDYVAAEAGYREGHRLLMESGGKAAMAASLAGFAGLALAQGQFIRAVRLFGAAHAILQALTWRLPPADDEAYERNMASVRAQLSEAAFNAAWDEGRALSMEQAIDYALSREEAQ